MATSRGRTVTMPRKAYYKRLVRRRNLTAEHHAAARGAWKQKSPKKRLADIEQTIRGLEEREKAEGRLPTSDRNILDTAKAHRRYLRAAIAAEKKAPKKDSKGRKR